MIEGVSRGPSGAGQFNVSDSGALIYVPGQLSTTAVQRSLALVDRKGNVTPLAIAPGSYDVPRVSPDGKRIAYFSDDGKEANIWIYELSGDSAPRKLALVD